MALILGAPLLEQALKSRKYQFEELFQKAVEKQAKTIKYGFLTF